MSEQPLASWNDRYLLPGMKIDPEERQGVMLLIDRLETALDLEPAVNTQEIVKRVNALDVIKTSEDRERIGELRKELIDNIELVKTTLEESIQRANRRHKEKTSRRASYLEPLMSAKATIDGIIEMDLEEQRNAAEEERRKAQEEADKKARAEQAERTRIANEAAAKERMARMEAQKALEKAQSIRNIEVRELARKRLEEAKEKERQAKLRLEETKNTQISATVIETKAVEKVEGIRTNKPRYRGRVVDISKLPEMYLMPRVQNQQMIDAECKARGQETRIPGVEVYLDSGAVVTKATR